ncbi:hypothetical protein DSM106972_031690 [Dulcicalothrix desertica PCC 7102]|uniref:Secretion protein HlyD n=1 Tax=Dulcicalothrix desertica PCC 7102 TaxID=232991 RepID=A0A433VIM1_9CYAN|nr:HlyD family efflux transporter periplasmic adaptor subunit [Dulcicalothrix desertica]RUT05963.1 hypothetical protein DSM106972_031690 [Dulcicalothrix desertica PCC 7102]TWH54362.1 biotin/lipoyl-binding protein [Dulcicalothrix desertica PCC 7102]
MEYSDSSGNVEQADPSQSITNTSNSQIVVAEQGVLVVHPQEISHLQVLSKPKSRKLLLMSLLSTGAVAVLIGGAVRWQYALTHEVTDRAYVATDTYAVNTRIPGQVVSVAATENQIVKKGSVLVKLNPLKYQAKVKQAQISLEQAQQQVKKATTNREAAKAKIKNQSKIQVPGQNDAVVVAARSQLKAAQSKLKPVFAAFAKAELDYEHFVKLHQSGNTPLKTLQDSKTKYDNLFKQHNSSIEKVRLARTKLTTAQQNYLDRQIKSAQQKVEDARKSSQEAKAKLQQKLELYRKKVLDNQAKSQQKIEQYSKNVLEVQAKVKKLKADHQKAVIQLEKQFAAKQEQQNKAITRLTTQKQVVTQQAETESLVLDYEKSQIYLKTAQTRLKQAQTQLKNAEYQLYYTKITAPNNGQINIKRTQAGQKVEPGQTLMSLVPQKPWIAADFEEEQLKKIKPGQSVQIQLKALTDKTFTGKVQSVLPPSKAQYNHLRPPVKISFDPKTLGKYKLLITPGTPASVKIEL